MVCLQITITLNNKLLKSGIKNYKEVNSVLEKATRQLKKKRHPNWKERIKTVTICR